MNWYRCMGGNSASYFVENCPIALVMASGSSSGADVSWEHDVQLGTGYTKLLATVVYYGPGATSGSTLGGSPSLTINSSLPVTWTKKSTVRNEPLAKALEYWEATLDPTVNIARIETSFSGYNANAGTHIVLTVWIE